MLLEFPAKEIDIWLEILQAESEEEKNLNSEKNTTADEIKNFFRGKITNYAQKWSKSVQCISKRIFYDIILAYQAGLCRNRAPHCGWLLERPDSLPCETVHRGEPNAAQHTPHQRAGQGSVRRNEQGVAQREGRLYCLSQCGRLSAQQCHHLFACPT